MSIYYHFDVLFVSLIHLHFISWENILFCADTRELWATDSKFKMTFIFSLHPSASALNNVDYFPLGNPDTFNFLLFSIQTPIFQ